MWRRRLVHMPLHELRTWIQPSKRTNTSKLRENFTKSSLCSNYHYLTPLSNLCMLALAPGFSLSALSCQSKCSVSSSIFIPCSLCLYHWHWHPSHCLFAVPILLAHLCSFPLSGLNSSFCLALCSLALFLWLSFLVFSGPLSYLALLPSPCMVLGSSWLLLAPSLVWST